MPLSTERQIRADYAAAKKAMDAREPFVTDEQGDWLVSAVKWDSRFPLVADATVQLVSPPLDWSQRPQPAATSSGQRVKPTMSADMKRLCEAALLASGRDDIELTNSEAEAIVRAVLTALREQMAGNETELWMAADPTGLYPGTEGFEHQFTSVIDHVLSPET